jgi:hypothetical protein
MPPSCSTLWSRRGTSAVPSRAAASCITATGARKVESRGRRNSFGGLWRWRFDDVRIRLYGASCGRRDALRLHSRSIGDGSGRWSPRVYRARTRRWDAESRSRSGYGGSERAAGWRPRTCRYPPSRRPPSRRLTATCRLLGGRRSPCCGFRGMEVREIARRLRRAASTISRELRRNAATYGGNLDYQATTAQWHAERPVRRRKRAKLAANAPLRTFVQDCLAGAVTAPGGIAVPEQAVPWKGRSHWRRQSRRSGVAWSPQQNDERLRLDLLTLCFPDRAASLLIRVD